jgi:hypothetical protein
VREHVEGRERILGDSLHVRLEERRECLPPCPRRVELLDVAGRHVGEEVERGVVGWSDADDDGDARDAVAEERGAGERMRTAAGSAGDGEPLETELVGERADVVRRVGDRAVRVRVGAAVAGRS